MQTILFDIDGTLINTGGAGGAALMASFRHEFAVTQPAPVAFSGRTDRAIASSLFIEHAIADSEENWQRLRAGYLARLGDELPARNGRVLPGVLELLAGLRQVENVSVGLLTGNIHSGAQIKLDYFGLFSHFAFGGYGDHHRDRDDVARMAVDEARSRLGGEFREDRVWVVGDTPHDITCARAINARVLAVETGVHPHDELAAAAPDGLLPDLSPTDKILRLLLDG